MMPLRVGVTASTRRREVGITVASLPASLALSQEADVDIWVVDHAGDVPRGSAGYVVLPGDLDLSGVSASVVVVDRGAAGHPGLAELPGLLSAIEEPALLEVRLHRPTSDSAARSALEACAIVRAVSGHRLEAAVIVRKDVHGIVLRGRADRRPVLVDVVYSDAGPAETTVRAIGTSRALEVRLPAAHLTGPAVVTVSDSEGAHQLPTVWEAPERATMRRLRDAVRGGTALSDVDDLNGDVVTLRAAGDF